MVVSHRQVANNIGLGHSIVGAARACYSRAVVYRRCQSRVEIGKVKKASLIDPDLLSSCDRCRCYQLLEKTLEVVFEFVVVGAVGIDGEAKFSGDAIEVTLSRSGNHIVVEYLGPVVHGGILL